MPVLAELFPQFASRLIRNGATLGGNLGTGSPIGDSPPVLLALKASLVLASRDGERTVELADYFTGYRQTLKRDDELIKTILIPLPLAPLSAFHKIAKRRFDDISSVAVGVRAPARRRPASPTSPSASAGWPPPRSARPRPRRPCSGSRGPPRPYAAPPRSSATRARPMDDHRASAVYRAAMLRQSLRKFYAQNPAPQTEEVAS